MSQGYKFSTVLGFHFHRYWEGERCLHLKWLCGWIKEKYIWLMDGMIRSNIQGAIAFTNDHSALWAWKMDDILLIVPVKILQWNLFINTFLTTWWILEIRKPHRSILKGGFKTIAGRRGFECDLKCHNRRFIQNIMPPSGILSLLVHSPHPDSLTISVQIKRK